MWRSKWVRFVGRPLQGLHLTPHPIGRQSARSTAAASLDGGVYSWLDGELKALRRAVLQRSRLRWFGAVLALASGAFGYYKKDKWLPIAKQKIYTSISKGTRLAEDFLQNEDLNGSVSDFVRKRRRDFSNL
eukprot:Trichotokara_eunicae@DN1293_c0_g1_i1.p1